MSHVWSREEDTLSPTGDETVSDVKALIRETPVRRSYVGKKRHRSKHCNCMYIVHCTLYIVRLYIVH